jgi:hypothetical protein
LIRLKPVFKLIMVVEVGVLILDFVYEPGNDRDHIVLRVLRLPYRLNLPRPKEFTLIFGIYLVLFSQFSFKLLLSQKLFLLLFKKLLLFLFLKGRCH